MMCIDADTEMTGDTGLTGDAVGGAVTGARLLGEDRRVGHEVDAGHQDAGRVTVEDDRAVHLGELAQPGRGERHVEGEAAGRHRLDLAVVAHDDQGAGAAAQDALEALTQGGAGCDGGQGAPAREASV